MKNENKTSGQYDTERLRILMDLLTTAAAEQDSQIIKLANSPDPQQRDDAASSLLLVANAYYHAAQVALQKHKSLLGISDAPEGTTKQRAKL